MKKQKVKLLQHVSAGFNESGEESWEYVDNGVEIVGYITPGASSDGFAVDRLESENTITLTAAGVHDYINRNDRLIYLGRVWLIDGFPAIWQNSRGYRSYTTITASFVEG